MNAVRLIMKSPVACIPVPPALRHCALEVILLPLDRTTVKHRRTVVKGANPIDEFVGAWCGPVLKRPRQGRREARKAGKLEGCLKSRLPAGLGSPTVEEKNAAITVYYPYKNGSTRKHE